jgi:hypothetical protein
MFASGQQLLHDVAALLIVVTDPACDFVAGAMATFAIAVRIEKTDTDTRTQDWHIKTVHGDKNS